MQLATDCIKMKAKTVCGANVLSRQVNKSTTIHKPSLNKSQNLFDILRSTFFV